MGASGGSNGVQVHKGNFPGAIASQPVDDSTDYSICKVHAVYPRPIAGCHSIGTVSALCFLAEGVGVSGRKLRCPRVI